jgi:Sigma-70 region 2
MMIDMTAPDPSPTNISPERANPEFERLAGPFRRELKVHCYRMLGSVHYADDLVQETYLRAWRHFNSFEPGTSLRAGCTGLPPMPALMRSPAARAAGGCYLTSSAQPPREFRARHPPISRG